MNSSALLSRIGLAVILASAIGCAKDPSVAKKEFVEKGNRQFEQKRYAEAAIEYRNAIAIDAIYADARLKLAQTYEKLADSPNALREYVRAADLLPNDAEVQVKAAAYLLAGGMFDDSLVRSRNALALNPRHVEARLLFAQATAGIKDFEAGVKEVEKSIEMNPTEPKSFAQLGTFRLAQGNLEKAEQAFKSAHEIAPNSVESLLGLGNFYMWTGRTSEAEQWLKKATAVAPQDRRAQHALSTLYLMSNRMAEAETPLKAYVEATPGPKARLILADYYFTTGRKGEARQILEAVKNEPQVFSDARLRLSVMEFAEKRLDSAQKILDEALARDPDNAGVLLMKGRYFLTDAKYGEAAETLKKAVSMNPKVAEAQFWLGVACRNVGDSEGARVAFAQVQALDPREVGSKLQLSDMALLDGRADAALELANQAVAQHPRNLQARQIRINALIAKNDLAGALSDANAVAAGAPEVPQTHIQLGRIYMKRNDYPAAERAYQRAVELSGSHDAVGGLIDARIRAGKLADARTAAEDALAKDPRNAWLHVYASRVHKAERDNAKAERALQEALALDPANLQPYLELTTLFVEQNRLEDARTQLEAIAARQPNAVWAHTMIGISFELQNRKAEARDRYQKALAIDSRAPIAANNLAMIYLEQGQNLGQALDLARAAVQKLPDSPQANDTLGSVYLKQNLPSMAVTQFGVSASKDPGNPVYHYHLGLAFAQLGDKTKARMALSRALALGKDFQGLAEAKRMLDTL